MKRSRLVVALVVALAHAAPVWAQSVEAIFESANEAYFAGELETAARRYHALVDAGVDDADVFFNLGVVEAARDRLGHALYAFESSLRIRPGDEGTLRARDAVVARIGRSRADREGEAVLHTDSNVLRALAKLLPAETVAVLCLVLAWIAGGCLVARVFIRRDNARLGLAIGATVAALLLAPSLLALSVHARWIGGGVEAIVLDDRVALLEGPDPRARLRAEAREGDRAEVGERIAGYVLLRVAGRGVGWAPVASVGTLEAASEGSEHPLH